MNQDTKMIRNGDEWRMPAERRSDAMVATDHRDNYYVATGDRRRGDSYYGKRRGEMNGSSKRNSLTFLEQRAKTRMELRRKELGNGTWRDIHSKRDAGYAVWSKSPSPTPNRTPTTAKDGGKNRKRMRKRLEKMSDNSSRSSSSSGSDTEHSVSSESTRSASSSEDSYTSTSSEYNRVKRVKKRSRYSRRDDKSRRSSRTRRIGRSLRRNERRHRRRYSTSSSSSSYSSSSSSSSVSENSGSSQDRNASHSSPSSSTQESPKNTISVLDTVTPRVNSEIVPSTDRKGTNLQDEMDEDDLREAREFQKAVQRKSAKGHDSDSDDMGPMPLVNPDSMAGAASGHQAQKSYGKALLPGEGEALAAYVQQNLRIPRRGEIGYDANEIEKYEKSGYVMSGSRHARMNAVRIRKENQVYSAEEQRALALITLEEKQQKEAALMNDFRKILKEKEAKMNKGGGNVAEG